MASRYSGQKVALQRRVGPKKYFCGVKAERESQTFGMCHVRASCCVREARTTCSSPTSGDGGTLMILCWIGSREKMSPPEWLWHKRCEQSLPPLSAHRLTQFRPAATSLNEFTVCEGLQPVTPAVEGAGTGGNNLACKPCMSLTLLPPCNLVPLPMDSPLRVIYLPFQAWLGLKMQHPR